MSEHLWRVKMLKGPKDCLNLHGTIFLIFFLTLWNKISSNARQYFCHIFWSFTKKISLKNSVLVISEIFSLFFNILRPDDKYSLSVKAITNATKSNASISKSKNVSCIFCCISGIETKFEILWKKRWASEVNYFLNYRLQKGEFFKCPKRPVSEHLWRVNILKGLKIA